METDMTRSTIENEVKGLYAHLLSGLWKIRGSEKHIGIYFVTVERIDGSQNPKCFWIGARWPSEESRGEF